MQLLLRQIPHQTEADPPPHLAGGVVHLGGKARVEDAGQALRRDGLAPVGDGKDLLPVLMPGGEGDADAAKCAMVEVDDNSYAEAFGRDVTSYFTARALTDSGSWGSGRLTGHIDLFGVLRAVMAKGKEESPDFTFEKEELTVKIAVERKNLNYLLEAETARLRKLTQKLQGAIVAVEALER